jgi:O-antigen ligase
MLTDHWATGIGLGSYTLLSPLYLKGFPDVHFQHAHNEYLELAIELGIPVAALFFSWLGFALCIAGKKLFARINSPASEIRSADIVGGAAFCALLGFFIHGTADFGWRLPANLFFAVTLAALMSFSLERQQSKKKYRIAD